MIEIAEKRRFAVSGESMNIFLQKCFSDRSSGSWQDGSILLKSKYVNDADFRSRWLFFYRPYDCTFLGEKQKKRISEIDSELYDLDQSLLVYSAQMFGCIVLGLLVFYSNSSYWLVTLCFLMVFIVLYIGSDNLRRKRNLILDERMSLDNEIKELVRVVKKVRLDINSDLKIHRKFWVDLRRIEEDFNENVFNKSMSWIRENTPDFYRSMREQREYLPNFPVIPAWGFMQPSQRNSIDNSEGVGVKKVIDNIGINAATWRNVFIDGVEKPFFRVWYVQFLMFQEKSVDVLTFYYDFVTKKKYSENIETYNYSHISNYSLVDLDVSYMIEHPIIKGVRLPSKLIHSIFGDEVKTLFFSSSSGVHYRCVLPDQSLDKKMIDWYITSASKEYYLDPGYTTEADREEMYTSTDTAHVELIAEMDKGDDFFSSLAQESLRELRAKVEEFSIREESLVN